MRSFGIEIQKKVILGAGGGSATFKAELSGVGLLYHGTGGLVGNLLFSQPEWFGPG